MNDDLNKTLPKGKAPLANLPAPGFVAISLLVVFFTYQVVGAVFTIAVTGIDADINSGNLNTMRMLITFAQFMLLLMPALMLNMLRGETLKDGMKLKSPNIPVTLLGLAGIIIIQPFLQFFVIIQNKILFSLPLGQEVINQLKEIFDLLENTTLKLVMAYSFPEFLVVVFVIAVTPAICEEFLFRGLILRTFEKSYSAIRAIIFTGLLFAIFHFHPFNLIPLIVLGFFISYIAHYSGSLYSAIIIHFVNNFISAVAVYLFGKEAFDDSSLGNGDLLWYGVAALLSFILFVLIIFIIKKIHNKSKGEYA